MNSKKTKKAIAKIIRQGHNHEIQELFNIIFEVMQEEFREDNFSTLMAFMWENVMGIKMDEKEYQLAKDVLLDLVDAPNAK